MANDVTSLLNDLIEVCRNGQFGFAEAAKAASDQHLAAVFAEISEQRNQFAAQLRYEVSRLGGRPADKGTVSGALHRRWMELRSAIADKADLVLIAECSRGEDHAEDAYRQALISDMPEDTRRLIEDQYRQIQHVRECVRNLEGKLNQQPAF